MSFLSAFARNRQLFVGLLALSTSTIMVAAASRGTVVSVREDLAQYWRTSYDILVRPEGASSEIEGRYGLIEANHLSGTFGGITFEQYEAIATIPGVEVAAPIAMLGYVPLFVETDGLGRLTEPGAYVLAERRYADHFSPPLGGSVSVRNTYFLVDTSYSVGLSTDANAPIVNYPLPVAGFVEFPFLVAGLDPVQEAMLVGLDHAITQGSYLQSDAPLNARPWSHIGEGPSTEITLPALINASSYVSFRGRVELQRLLSLPEGCAYDCIMAHGGTGYLSTLPREAVAHLDVDIVDLYDRLLARLQGAAASETPRGLLITFAQDLPSRIVYEEEPSTIGGHQLVLRIVMPETEGYAGEPAFRSYSTPDSAGTAFDAAFTIRLQGVFDIERIPHPSDVNRVPMETYIPPLATLLYDEAGRAVEPHVLSPTLNTAGYIQPPPLVLTTLDAARAIRGDAAISAIRLRLGGIDELTPAAQSRVEAIASEIVRRTGLTVDVTVGSSPTRVLVHVPGVGYVEEQWIRKGVSTAYSEEVQFGHWILLGSLLGVGGLFTMSTAWAGLIARHRVLCLTKALGWRSSTLLAYLVRDVVTVAAMAYLGGVLLAWVTCKAAGWQVPTGLTILGVGSVVVGSSALASLYPAWLASNLPPVIGIQRGALVRSARNRHGSIMGIRAYAALGLARSWRRNAPSIAAIAGSVAILVLMTATTTHEQGLLNGTLLGEFILVRIEVFHYTIAGVGLGLGAVAAANMLLADVVERQNEVGLLKAVGWTTAAVGRVFFIEGTLIGAIGGATGGVLGAGVLMYLSRALPPSFGLILLLAICLPTLAGAISGLFPARAAAAIPPAVTIRHE